MLYIILGILLHVDCGLVSSKCTYFLLIKRQTPSRETVRQKSCDLCDDYLVDIWLNYSTKKHQEYISDQPVQDRKQTTQLRNL